jgi:aspartyl-tRNA(Asn)/glutamyl-tRNA(Gln) amidotransferase subunit C
MEVQRMAEITKDQVKHVANLARLEITEQEAEMFTEQLSSIITFAEQLNELDTDGIEPTTHVLDLKNVMRKDEPRQWITREDALKNAPDQKDGQFRVPSILAD